MWVDKSVPMPVGFGRQWAGNLSLEIERGRGERKKGRKREKEGGEGGGWRRNEGWEGREKEGERPENKREYQQHSPTHQPPALSPYLPGATMISFFLVLILRKERSFWGSKSLTVVRDLLVSRWTRPAYWTVVALSMVVRMGIPEHKGHPWQCPHTRNNLYKH